MNARKLPFAALALAIAVLGTSGRARADFLTQTFTHASQAVPYTYTFAANQFNPTMGTLNSVVISLTSNITGEIDVYNFNPTTQSFTNATASVPVTLTGPNGTVTAIATTTPPASGTVGPASIGTLPGGGTGIVAGMTAVTGQLGSVSNTSTLTGAQTIPFQGTGTNSLSFAFGAGLGNYGGTANPGVAFSGSASADARIVITYNFTPVPEPASVALLGFGGLAGLVGRRVLRRRGALS